MEEYKNNSNYQIFKDQSLNVDEVKKFEKSNLFRLRENNLKDLCEL